MARELRIRQLTLTMKPDDKVDVLAEGFLRDGDLSKSISKELTGQSASATIGEILAAVVSPLEDANDARMIAPSAPAAPASDMSRGPEPRIDSPVDDGDGRSAEQPSPPVERR
jgi:hypothetical protein